MTPTVQEAMALAPDDASAKAARGLVSPAKWPLLGANDAAAWGECQGSGSKPYQTQVDLSGPAFRCSCPRRKFPCKHGLALLLLRAEHGGRFAAGEPPAWVGEWLASRGEQAQKKDAQQVEKAATPADPLAAAKREGQRWTRIEGAALDLQRFLADQLARGLGTLDPAALKTWSTMAARVVDAQAPGLAARLQDTLAGVRQGEQWPERTLQGLGLLQLACDAIARRAAPAPGQQADLRTLAGWPHDQAEVCRPAANASPTAGACWAWPPRNAAHQADRTPRVAARRAHGARRVAARSVFAGRGFDQAWVAGSAVEAALAYFPSAAPLRALVVERGAVVEAGSAPSSAEGESPWRRVAERAAACPWVTLHPVLLHDAVVDVSGERAWVRQGASAWPLQSSDTELWRLLACTGGAPATLAGEWDGDGIRPLTAWTSAGAPAWIKETA